MVRRKSQRKQRERGCTIYIPASALQKAGVSPDGPPPLYRVWGNRRGSILVRLYKND